MSDFDEVCFFDVVVCGVFGGLEWCMEIVELILGFEECNMFWVDSWCKYDVGFGICYFDYFVDVIFFFEVCFGCLCGFCFKDWVDYKFCKFLEVLGLLD